MKISIVGTGYVGLVTGACLAAKGHSVVCVDVDAARVAALNSAVSPIYEAGLQDLLREHVGHTLTASIDLTSAVRDSEATFIAVGTPFAGEGIDLTAVLAAARQIGEALRDKESYHLVVVKSTVVPGTTDRSVVPVLEAASGKRANRDFGVGMNPEFLSEGEAIADFMCPDRIVLGGNDARAIACLERVYEPFPDAPRVRTNTRTAEMIKYTSNALLATLVSFTNEIANLGASIGEIDTSEVMQGVHLSQYFKTPSGGSRAGITSFLRAGCGFGGSCLPKDVKALIAHGRTERSDMPLLEAVIKVNEAQPSRMVDLLSKHWPSLQGVRVTVLGLAFKPGTSDVRESPAFPIIHELNRRGATVKAFDPIAADEARKMLNGTAVTYADSLRAALDQAQAVIVVTPWEQFAEVPELVRASPDRPVLVDCRRVFDKASADRYEGVGL